MTAGFRTCQLLGVIALIVVILSVGRSTQNARKRDVHQLVLGQRDVLIRDFLVEGET